MAEANWTSALAFVWRPENDGQPLHRTDGDPGGDTAWGVIATTYQMAVAHGYVSGTIDTATQAQCGTVLHAFFWLSARCQDLPSGVDLVVFNIAMCSGTGEAVRLLQRSVCVDDDGLFGDVTLTAVRAAAPGDLIAKLTATDEAFLESLNTFRLFGDGWTRRANDCETAGLRLAGAPAQPPSPDSADALMAAEESSLGIGDAT
jgi:lysozyme family protein